MKMPHFGLMDEDALGSVEGPLMRAKLHMRAGKRRLRQGKISMGILTLYDAVNSAMQWYIALPERRTSLQIKAGEDVRRDATAYAVLTRSKVIDGSLNYEAFDKLADRALYEDMSSYDCTELLRDIEAMMAQLGIMPFNENDLPPEDPSTF